MGTKVRCWQDRSRDKKVVGKCKALKGRLGNPVFLVLVDPSPLERPEVDLIVES